MGEAKPIQRFPIGEDGIETTDPNNRNRILNYLRSINTDQMRDILARLLQEPNHPNHVEYIQICRVELSRSSAIQEIGGASHHFGGIWTGATVLLESGFLFKTNPVRTGDVNVSDEYIEGGRCSGHEKRISALDSEVGTLHQLGMTFDQAIEEDKTRPHRQRIFEPGNRVMVLIVGNIGPCDGCKQRLENFWIEFKTKFEALWVNFTMEVNYLTEPRETERNGHGTTYGYHGDPNRYSVDNCRYYFHRWG